MFKLNIYLRFGLIALTLIGGTLLAIFMGFWYAFPILLIGLILVLGYIFLGTVQSAAEYVQASDLDGAEKMLGLTLKPNWLYVTNRAYFYIMKGTIAQQRGDNNSAEVWIKKAEGLKLPTDNEKAAVQLQLANIAGMKNKWNQAKVHFRNAKQYKVSDNSIKEQIRQFEKALSNRGQMKAAGRMGAGQKGNVMNPGGKRKRPKMR